MKNTLKLNDVPGFRHMIWETNVAPVAITRRGDDILLSESPTRYGSRLNPGQSMMFGPYTVLYVGGDTVEWEYSG